MSHDTTSAAERLRVAIIGGGIAGLSAAAFLRRHAQLSVTIYERRDAGFQETSAGIGIMKNGISVAKQLGIDREDARGVFGAGFRTYNIREEEVSRSLVGDGPDGSGALWLIFRQDLRDALLRMVGDEKGVGQPVNVVYGSRVVGVDPEAGVLDFADGTSVESDLIIGADGIHSVIRNAVIPSTHPVPAPCGLSMYRFVLPMDIVKNAIGHDHGYPAMCDYSKGSFVSVMAAGDEGNRNVVMYPCRGHELMNIAFAVPDGSVRDADQLKYSWNAAGNKEVMVETLRGFPEWLQRVFRCASRVHLFQIRDIEPLPTYIKGRTVLIGDAAHAMVPYQGQGANQAFEDAEGLNAVFAGVTERDEIPARLRIWDSVRRPRATEIQKGSRSSQTKIASKEASEAISSVRPYTSMKEALEQLQGNKLVV